MSGFGPFCWATHCPVSWSRQQGQRGAGRGPASSPSPQRPPLSPTEWSHRRSCRVEGTKGFVGFVSKSNLAKRHIKAKQPKTQARNMSRPRSLSPWWPRLMLHPFLPLSLLMIDGWWGAGAQMQRPALPPPLSCRHNKQLALDLDPHIGTPHKHAGRHMGVRALLLRSCEPSPTRLALVPTVRGAPADAEASLALLRRVSPVGHYSLCQRASGGPHHAVFTLRPRPRAGSHARTPLPCSQQIHAGCSALLAHAQALSAQPLSAAA